MLLNMLNSFLLFFIQGLDFVIDESENCMEVVIGLWCIILKKYMYSGRMFRKDYKYKRIETLKMTHKDIYQQHIDVQMPSKIWN